MAKFFGKSYCIQAAILHAARLAAASPSYFFGGSTAWIGFAGATGGRHREQVVSNFSFAVPEPATWILGMLGLAGLAVVKRRRTV